ncbi:MAG TPA: ABC transporter ATP-binding protein [Thermomicrobiales bacterium]|nr:ABC transporter ATP-binding protein [Thermomicrobiales bacterium]
MTITSLTPAVDLEHVRIDRGGQTIVPDLSLSVPTGSVFGLVGPSGSGKTTIMRGLLGLTKIRAGRALVLGERAGSADLRSRIGFMPQGEGVYPDLSARENLAFFAGLYRVPKPRIDELLEIMDLAAIADRAVVTYSGGQRQRVGLAIALLHDPPLMILDEPTIGLDPRLRHHLWGLFRDWAARGTTLLVSTHVMDEASKCDQIAFLLDGRLTAVGTPDSLLERTRTDDLESAVLALSEGREVQNVA